MSYPFKITTRSLDIRRNWDVYAVKWYGLFYTHYDKTNDEYRWLRNAWWKLRKTMPEQYKSGVYLLMKGAAYCGENVYVVDGRLEHNLWLKCVTCGGIEVLSRYEFGTWIRGRGWCVTCNKFVDLHSW